MKTAAAQQRTESLIRYLLEGTSSQTGQEFFRALVHSVAQAMNVAGVKSSPDSSGGAMSNIFTSLRKWNTRRTR